MLFGKTPISRRSFFLKKLFSSFSLFVLIGSFLIFFSIYYYYFNKAKRYDLSFVKIFPLDSVIIDAKGKKIGAFKSKYSNNPVEVNEVSDYFIKALISREDFRFYKHKGVDYIAIIRSWLRNLKEKRIVQGGSTITMQLARMVYDLDDRTLNRKLLEIAIAKRIEKKLSKEEILFQYINRVFLGTGLHGIVEASKWYFNKYPKDLNLSESAMLVGIIRAPNRFSPFRHYKRSLNEMLGTLRGMKNNKVIADKEFLKYSNIKPKVMLELKLRNWLSNKSRYYGRSYKTDMVRRWINDKFKNWLKLGGLTINTTFDLSLQKTAQLSIEDRIKEIELNKDYVHPKIADYKKGETKYLQVSASVIENKTGAVRVIIGGRNFNHSKFNRAISTNRHMGSIFKPLVYATAFEKGLLPGVLISDKKIEKKDIPWWNKFWSPNNSDDSFGEYLPAKIGLIRSRNTMSVRVGETAGMENVLKMIDLSGVSKKNSFLISPSIYIGSLPSSCYDISSAYSVFATGGIRNEPYFVSSILDRNNKFIYKHKKSKSYKVISHDVALITSNILEKVIEEGGSGHKLRKMGFKFSSGGKTGTTNDFFDAWFAGYTSRLSSCIWIGFDTPKTISKNAYGGEIAIPIWYDIMEEAHKVGYKFEKLYSSNQIIKIFLCRHSGLLPNERCKNKKCSYLEELPHTLIPRDKCDIH